MRVGISAGEASGDALGAELMRGLASRVDRIEVRGIAGRAMQTAGGDPLARPDAVVMQPSFQANIEVRCIDADEHVRLPSTQTTFDIAPQA